jgi:hypothetical protein
MSVNDSTYRAIFGDGTSVLERVLLAIINAHTTDETEGHQQERLDAAMVALIGPATQVGHDFERALHFMARHRQRDTCDLEMTSLQFCGSVQPRAARSVPELATAATREILGIFAADEKQATARVLCEMFRLRGKVHAVVHDHVRDALEAEAVQRLCNELAEWDVTTRL